MNKADAKKIAMSISREQLSAMMESAKLKTTNWRETSSVNPYFTKGKTWNVFYPVFTSGRPLSIPAITNMVWEFGDFLSDELKPKKKTRTKDDPAPYHEEPIFGET